MIQVKKNIVIEQPVNHELNDVKVIQEPNHATNVTENNITNVTPNTVIETTNNNATNNGENKVEEYLSTADIGI